MLACMRVFVSHRSHRPFYSTFLECDSEEPAELRIVTAHSSVSVAAAHTLDHWHSGQPRREGVIDAHTGAKCTLHCLHGICIRVSF